MENTEILKKSKFELFMLKEFTTQLFWEKIKSLTHNRINNSIKIVLEEIEILDKREPWRLFHENEKVIETENYEVYWKMEFEVPSINLLNSIDLNELSIVVNKLIPLTLTIEDLISYYERNPINVWKKSLEFIAELLNENEDLKNKLNPAQTDLVYRQSLIKMISDNTEEHLIWLAGDSNELPPVYSNFEDFLKDLEWKFDNNTPEMVERDEGNCCWNCPNCDGWMGDELEIEEDEEKIYDDNWKAFSKYSVEKTQEILKELVEIAKKNNKPMKIAYAYPKSKVKTNWKKEQIGEKIYIKKFIPYHFERKNTSPTTVYLVALDVNRDVKRWLNLSKVRFEN